MPTLRKFFKHFAPSFMGGSSANPSSYAYNGRSSAYALSNHGARKQRKKYEQFPEENELRTFNSGEGKRTPENDSDKVRTSGGVVSVNVAGGGADVDADNRSDKAILQTKSFTVTYN